MARYLVIHSPNDQDAGAVEPPTRMIELAREAGQADSNPRWLSAFSPDLNDDRIFTMWEADQGADILAALKKYDFLTHLDAKPIRVQAWGPNEVLTTNEAFGE